MLNDFLNVPIGEYAFGIKIVLYLIAVATMIGVTILIVKFLKNKTFEQQKRIIFIILVIGCFFHYGKLLFSPYKDLDYPINPLTKITFENICAVSIIIFPFIYYSKSNIMKDYMILLGMISGLLSVMLPFVVEVSPLLSFDPFRFYIVHYIIFLVPFLMYKFKIHEVSMDRAKYIPLVLLGVLALVFVNEVVVTYLGWIPKEELFDPSKRNPSLVFGLKELSEGIEVFFTVFTPKFLMDVSFMPHGSYLPVVWMTGPALVYGSLICVGMHFALQKDITKEWFKNKYGTKHLVDEWVSEN